jgi:hypothetical protein
MMDFIAANVVMTLVLSVAILSCNIPMLWDRFKR